jgi:hypothetical protein
MEELALGLQLTSNAASILSRELGADDFEAALGILVVVANADGASEGADGEEWDKESESEMHGCWCGKTDVRNSKNLCCCRQETDRDRQRKRDR